MENLNKDPLSGEYLDELNLKLLEAGCTSLMSTSDGSGWEVALQL